MLPLPETANAMCLYNNNTNNRDVAAYFRKAHAADPLYLPAITYHCIKGCADAAVIVELCCVTATHALAAQCIEVWTVNCSDLLNILRCQAVLLSASAVPHTSDCLESLERCVSHLQKRAEVVQVQRLLHPLRHQLRNAAASNATAVADEELAQHLSQDAEQEPATALLERVSLLTLRLSALKATLPEAPAP
eukprot:1756-Heterococcus_DN1.PRE.1